MLTVEQTLTCDLCGGVINRLKITVPPSGAMQQANTWIGELNKKLGVDKVKLVTSPLQVDTTPQSGHNTQGAAPGQMVAAPPNPVYAPKTTLRGNCWPTTEEYYRKK